MKSIGIDIDEVLSKTVIAFLGFYNDKHGTDFTYEHIKEYSFSKTLGISFEEEKQNIMDFFASDYFPDLPTIEGSESAVKELSTRYQLYAVSSRPPQLIGLTTVWLDKHYKGCFKEIILTNSHFDSSITKSSVCTSRQLDYFVEDQLQFAEDCAGVCLKVFLLNKPWNQAIISNNVVRVKNWPELLSILG